MSIKLNNLNEQLERTSKKFAKACDQIKLLKNRINELAILFSYVANISNNEIEDESSTTNDNMQSEQETITTRQPFTNSNYHHQQINLNDYNVSLYKEQIRQQIENLQSIKSAYFLYAHAKADEITRLQCEIYGEDAVREAYEHAEPSVLIAAEPENRDEQSNTNTSERNQANANDSQQNEDNWTPWDFNSNNTTSNDDTNMPRDASDSTISMEEGQQDDIADNDEEDNEPINGNIFQYSSRNTTMTTTINHHPHHYHHDSTSSTSQLVEQEFLTA